MTSRRTSIPPSATSRESFRLRPGARGNRFTLITDTRALNRGRLPGKMSCHVTNNPKVLSRIGDLWSVKNSCCWSTLAAWRHIVGETHEVDSFRRGGLSVCPSVSCHVTTGRDAGKFKRWRLYGEERPVAVAKKRLGAAKALARSVARPNSYRRADPQGLTQCCRALSQRLHGAVMICPHL